MEKIWWDRVKSFERDGKLDLELQYQFDAIQKWIQNLVVGNLVDLEKGFGSRHLNESWPTLNEFTNIDLIDSGFIAQKNPLPLSKNSQRKIPTQQIHEERFEKFSKSTCKRFLKISISYHNHK